MRVYNNTKITCLFPFKTSNLTLEDRIKEYLKEEDYQWAFKFCNLLINREDYSEIKKELSSFNLDLFQKYHEFFISKLVNNPTASEFVEFANTINYIKTMAASSAASVVTFNVDFMYDSKQISDLENAYNTIAFFLGQEDNPVIMEIERRFYNKVKDRLIDDTLNNIYLVEKGNLLEYSNNHFLYSYKTFCRKKEEFRKKEHNFYTRNVSLKRMKIKMKLGNNY